jgi:preprotein translocase subunit SecD
VRRFLPILILILGALAIYIDLPGSHFLVLSSIDGGLNQQLDTKLGLDLQGGLQLTYKAVYNAGNAPTSDQMNVIRSILEGRINTTGAKEPIVQTAGNDRILIEVPGAQDPQEIRNLVQAKGLLQFVLLPPADYGTSQAAGTKTVPQEGAQIDPSLVVQYTGADLDASQVRARYDTSTTPPAWVVDFAFKGTAADSFATWTNDHINDFFAIVLDGKVVSAPSIEAQIKGSGYIHGSFTQTSAKQLATILSYGALPYPVQELTHMDIPATLGASFLAQTLLAGGIGIGLVLLFMLVYYRLPGVVACLALAYYGLAVLALFRIVPVTLTLAGIAGFVLSVGMAVDANILIFERTKEELRTGKSLISAVEAGFNRALNSIIDSNVSSLITATILYFGGSPTIKGFALVLIIGVATSMFTAVTVSRTLMRLVVKQSFAQKAWLFGVTDEEFQARALPGRSRREARGRV